MNKNKELRRGISKALYEKVDQETSRWKLTKEVVENL